MLQATLIGNIGADAVKQAKDGREFVTFRVAHNDRWTDQSGTEHSTTIWIDCILNGHPNVADYLKAGTQVYISGRITLRVYSSEKDRCMKAGMTINVQSIELLGGKTDTIPSRLYTNDGVMLAVEKFYWCQLANAPLLDQRGNRYLSNEQGFVFPVGGQETPPQQQPPEQTATDQQPAENKTESKTNKTNRRNATNKSK